MMENHAFGQIANNPQAPFINSLMAKVNLATNYYAIAHPSSTNYLEVVGGSNFNKLSDQYPDWHNANCIPNIVPGQPTNTDNPNSGVFCPISGKDGTAAAIAVLDTSMNETSAPPLTNINGTLSIRAGIIGADGVNVSDGFYSIGGNNAEGVNYDADDNGTQQGLNPSLIMQGNLSNQRIETAIKAIAGLARQPKCHHHPLGRKRLQHTHVKSGCLHRRNELRKPPGPKFEVLRPLLAHQDPRCGLAAAVPESRMRRGRGSHVGLVPGISKTHSPFRVRREVILPP